MNQSFDGVTAERAGLLTDKGEIKVGVRHLHLAEGAGCLPREDETTEGQEALNRLKEV